MVGSDLGTMGGAKDLDLLSKRYGRTIEKDLRVQICLVRVRSKKNDF
jgi:hypothetical protein